MRNGAYKPKAKPRGKPRGSKSLMGYKGILTRAINTSTDGAYAELDLTTVKALIGVLDRNIAAAKEREDGPEETTAR